MQQDKDRARGHLALAILRPLLPRAEAAEVIADLEAEHAERRGRTGRLRAGAWLWGQVFLSLPSLLARSLWRGRTGFEPKSSRFQPGGPWIEGWLVDLRYAARHLLARPAYALVDILTLDLCLGGAVAVSSIVRSYLLVPLPLAAEEELVSFWGPYDWSEAEHSMLRPDYPGFVSVAAHRDESMTLRQGDGPARLLDGVAASAELFATLGRQALFGRTFEPADDVAGAEAVVVLSHRLWQTFGGKAGILGSSLTLDGAQCRVVGVMPPDFWFPRATVDIWMAQILDPENFSGNYALVGRLEQGRELASMDGPLAEIAGILGQNIPYPPEWDKTRDPHLIPLRQELLGEARPTLLATQAAMLAILLMAAANVAALMLGHLGGRAGELALRSALGAPRGRLARQLFAEAMLLGLGAGFAAAGVAAATFRILSRTLPLGPLADTLSLDWTLLASAIALGLLTAAAVTLVPIIDLARGDLRGALSDGGSGFGRSDTGVRTGRMESALVVGEIALAVLLAAGTALLARSVDNLGAIDPGLETAGVAVLEIAAPADLSHLERRGLLYDLHTSLASLPGVRSVAAVQHLPLQSGSWSTDLEVEGAPRESLASTYFRMVTPGYFDTMGLELRRGRGLNPADAASEEALVVVNEALARRFFAGENPLGRRISHGMGPGWARIVGVVEDEAVATLTDAPAATRYMLYDHVPFTPETHGLVLAAEPGRDAARLAAEARQAVEVSAPGVAVARATSLEQLRRESMGAAPKVLRLIGLLGILALILGAVGVYGVISHFVNRRSREWSLRLVLGLRPAQIIGLILRRSSRLLVLGLAVGLAACGLLGPFLASLLYGVDPADPALLSVALAILLLTGLLAALLPAWRAGKSDPATLLRGR